ncbi:MAG: inorganic diphosphatase, partial [Spirochaetales bacterium]
DHNEFSQSVDGIERALVEEVLDHHRIGMERTAEPITVINRVVGSTCSIVADMYRTSGHTPSAQGAGLMLSGLLADTVMINSPTTTELDRSLADWLSGIAGVDIEEYGRAMFAAGSQTGTMSAPEILAQDRKHYQENGHAFSVGQFEMVGFEEFWARASELQAALDQSREAAGLWCAALMVTDITTSTTLLVVSGPRSFRDRIAYPEPADGVYEMRGVLSRKKQLLPLLLEIM